MLINSLNTSTSETPRHLILICTEYYPSLLSLLFYGALNFLLLPFYFSVLYVGFQQWRQRGTISIGNSDVFTYNLALLEIFGVFGAIIFTAGSWAKSLPAIGLSFCLLVVTFIGQTAFHCAICFDRYLAVVHPISYRHLKEARAVRIWNVCVVLTWVFCLLWIARALTVFPDYPAKDTLVLTGIFFTLYCCLYALYVLTRPGPNGKRQSDKSKLRAFFIISTITGLLLLKFIGFLVNLCVYIFAPLNLSKVCLTLTVSIELIVPINALIPLLFLCRVKKLTCCKLGMGP